MKIKLVQNEIQKAIAEYVSARTEFKVKDSVVVIKAEYSGSYGEQEVSGFYAEIELDN
jgi:hypothetical protein